MSDRPRGRGIGRGRQPQQAHQQRGPTPQEQRGPAPQGAWGAPRGHQASTQAWGARPQQSQPRGGPPAPGASWGPRPGGVAAGISAPPRPQTSSSVDGRATTRHDSDVRNIRDKTRSIDIAARGDSAQASEIVSGRGSTRGRKNVKADLIRTRPQNRTTKSGTLGNSISLITNYFELISKPDWCLYMYRVDFSPEEDHTGMKKKMVRPHNKVLGGYIFDGSQLYTSHRLHPDPLEVFSEHPVNQTQVRITIRLVKDLAHGDYQYLQFFNIIMRKCLSHLRLQLVGRNFFDAIAKIDIREYRLEVWPGYVTSIRQHEQKVLLCCEIAHKVMRRDSVLDLLKECYDDKNFQQTFKRKIIGSVVLTDYNNRTYRVDDVDFETTPSSTFEKRDKSHISYRDYFRQKYEKNIRDLHQPMLISRSKPREIRAGMSELVYLVPELCRMTGLTDAQRANFQLMQALQRYTRVGPVERVQQLQDFARRLTSNQEILNTIAEWDLKLAKQLVELKGRQLPPEKVFLGPSSNIPCPADEKGDWTNHLRNKPMVLSAKVTKWSCIFPARFKQDVDKFLRSLKQVADQMYFNFPRPDYYEMSDNRLSSYVEALDVVLNEYRPQCILCILPNNKADIYNACKKKCYVDKAVPLQMMVAKTMSRNLSVVTKIAIQMNCKLGGVPWTVSIPLKSLMVIGFDVCHDTIKKTDSFGAMVASMNSTCTRYFSTCTPHRAGDELSNNFAVNIVNAVRKYKEVNGVLPSPLVIYRDGVGDGQIDYVYNHEVELIKERLQEIYPENSLKMAFVIVSKRINTRFFKRDGAQNPLPGTVVDDVVTLPERYDFFIISQSVRQGSVAPTSYNVISDTTGLTPDHMQCLAYKLCHLYYNCSVTVRVPAPVQFAHKLAFLVGQSIHCNPNSQLEDLLYYL